MSQPWLNQAMTTTDPVLAEAQEVRGGGRIHCRHCNTDVTAVEVDPSNLLATHWTCTVCGNRIGCQQDDTCPDPWSWTHCCEVMR